ncbi:hypothetical protein V865_007979 [Kwoniella europaea PYCC6329]|uniref:Uncharacterized protein n=1 Tax=Kwoniella europaea PYCC6329 TaxID=1423913 RepID=A0AAX4KTS8_9TREE
MKGVLAFSEKISQYDIRDRSWRWTRAAALNDAERSARNEYIEARTRQPSRRERDRLTAEYRELGESRQDELRVPYAAQDGLIRRFREANGWWNEDDDVVDPVPRERLQQMEAPSGAGIGESIHSEIP